MGTWNPYAITNATDSFSVQSQGFVQGDVQADPATRFQIAGGNVALTESLPLWGGIAIYEATPPAQPAGGFNGSTIGRALNASQISGFSVQNGSNAAPTNPQNTAPTQAGGFGFNYVRLGSNNRVVVACSSSVLALVGSYNPLQFSWDQTSQTLVPYAALSGSSIATVASATYANGVITFVTAAAHGLTTGNYATISGAAPIGFNVSGPVVVTNTTTFSIAAPNNPGTLTTPGVVYSGLGGFKATLVDVNAGNSSVIVYNSTTGNASWNNSGNAALILI